jgi:hypothetical protein
VKPRRCCGGTGPEALGCSFTLHVMRRLEREALAEHAGRYFLSIVTD